MKEDKQEIRENLMEGAVTISSIGPKSGGCTIPRLAMNIMINKVLFQNKLPRTFGGSWLESTTFKSKCWSQIWLSFLQMAPCCIPNCHIHLAKRALFCCLISTMPKPSCSMGCFRMSHLRRWFKLLSVFPG